MAEIYHAIGIKADTNKIYKALTEIQELAKWWTSDTRGDAKQGGTIQFWFGEFHKGFKVNATVENRSVKWTCLVGAEEWIGTEIEIRLEPSDNDVSVHFKHSKWKDSSGHFAHCSMKWAVFLLSLRDHLEKGKGQPYPNDVQINHD